MLYANCYMQNAKSKMRNATCYMPNASCKILHVKCKMLDATCYMLKNLRSSYITGVIVQVDQSSAN